MPTGVRKSPKTLATINFKGGVGKTTVTWCLADLVSSFSNTNVLMFDLDAQMSLTQAIALNEATGNRSLELNFVPQRSIAAFVHTNQQQMRPGECAVLLSAGPRLDCGRAIEVAPGYPAPSAADS
jgi:cellulose biosynthesis protein BcsQ